MAQKQHSLNFENDFKTQMSNSMLKEIKIRKLYRFQLIRFNELKLHFKMLISLICEKN